SQPFTIAITVYWPGTTFGKVNVPSLSLWSRRNSGELFAGSCGTRTTMAPAKGCPSRSATPSTCPRPRVTTPTIRTLLALPMSSVRPVSFAPVTDSLLKENLCPPPSNRLYRPGLTVSSLKSNWPLSEMGAAKFSPVEGLESTMDDPFGTLVVPSKDTEPLIFTNPGASPAFKSASPTRSISRYQPRLADLASSGPEADISMT